MVLDLSGGTIQLQAVEVEHGGSKCGDFVVVDNDGRAWNLRAQSREDALVWIQTITSRSQVKDLTATS